MYIFMKHANLADMFNRYSHNSIIGWHVAHKRIWSALKRSTYRYVIKHIPGNKNVKADQLSRWKAAFDARAGHTSFLVMIHAPMGDEVETTDWPDMNMFQQVQQNTTEQNSEGLKVIEVIIKDIEDRVCIPQTYTEIRILILVRAHGGWAGNHEKTTTLKLVQN